MIASGYRERADIASLLNAVISHDEQVPPTWQIPVGPALFLLLQFLTQVLPGQ